MKHYFLKVEGIVQGVGFRPFVYNAARKCKLNGWVNNNSQGVHIHIEGDEKHMNEFMHLLKNSPPPLSKVKKLSVIQLPLENFESFAIKDTKSSEDDITFVSPDMAICNECLTDVLDPENRRHEYPFTNCTNCGPRYSIIQSMPYDRAQTTMNRFQMCPSCSKEYSDPSCRRFHAQPNACEACGPHLWIENNTGKKLDIPSKAAIFWTRNQLKKGRIFAIKGIGGFHLACNALDNEAVSSLRTRKHRPHKPFAVMMRDVETVKKYCHVNEMEEQALLGCRKPILLLERRKDVQMPGGMAPKQKTLGVMLPYTPLHVLLLDKDMKMLVMTSGNSNGLPIEYTNEGARKRLSIIADYFLMHNREIHVPIDDSVARYMACDMRMIRRARGYVPEPVEFDAGYEILAMGAAMKNTFAVSKAGYVFLSQHMGDLFNIETLTNYEKCMEHLMKLFKFTPDHVAYDPHPEFMSAMNPTSFQVPGIACFHHHSHIASCMVENAHEGNCIGFSYDGTGYGRDGKMWGGEVLTCSLEDFKREAHLDYTRMCGGDISVEEPWRMAVSYICKAFDYNHDRILRAVLPLFGPASMDVAKLVSENINCVETSSMGRFLDAISAILGICTHSTYEGQASSELEGIIPDRLEYSSECCYECQLHHFNDEISICLDKVIIGVLDDMASHISKNIISYKVHNTVIKFSVECALLIRKASKINHVALSGGVFQNRYIFENLVEELHSRGFVVLTHKKIPCNDGGISLGQTAIAAKKARTR